MQGKNPLLFTRGQTLELGGDLYLVAYQQRSSPILDNVAMVQQMMERGQEQEQSTSDPLEALRLAPETEVTLQLLNVHVMGHMKDISVFNMQVTNAELDKAELIARKGQSLQQLRQLAQMTQMYTRQNNGKLPPVTTFGLLQSTVGDAGGRPGRMPRQSDLDKMYLTNLALTGHKLADFPRPEDVVLVYEAKPWPDGKRGVAFLDGHAGFMSEAEWAKLKEKVK